MQTNKRDILTKAFSVLMISIISFMIYNQAAYIHTHTKADGTRVSHAHPFSKDSESMPIKGHTHTSYQYVAFDHLNLLFLALTILLTILFSRPQTLVSRMCIPSYTPPLLLQSQGRAPPIC